MKHVNTRQIKSSIFSYYQFYIQNLTLQIPQSELIRIQLKYCEATVTGNIKALPKAGSHSLHALCMLPYGPCEMPPPASKS